MVLSRQLTLTNENPKKNIVKADAGVASGNVIVTYDRDVPQSIVINDLQKCIEEIIENEYKEYPPS